MVYFSRLVRVYLIFFLQFMHELFLFTKFEYCANLGTAPVYGMAVLTTLIWYSFINFSCLILLNAARLLTSWA